MVSVDAALYRGSDRRARSQTRRSDAAVGVLPTLVLVFALVVMVVAATNSGLHQESVYLFLRNAVDALLLLAGAAHLTVWRITGRATPGFAGAGLLVIGGLLLPMQAVGLVLHDDQRLRLIAPASQLALQIPAALIMLRGSRARSVDASLNPTCLGAGVAGVGIVAILALGAVRFVAGPLDSRTAWVIAMLVLGACWLAVAAAYGWPANRTAYQQQRRLGLAVGGLGIGAALLAVGVVDGLQIAAAGAAVQALAAAGILASGLRALERSLGQQGSRTLRLAGELGDTVRVLAEEQATREEMLHDARSTLAAIRMANGTLTTYQERLDELLKIQLHDAVGSELIRLEQLLSPDYGRETMSFELGAAIEPVVRTAAEGGLAVSLRASGTFHVRGRPADLATVVHTVLTNASRYAPHLPVELTAEKRGEFVRLSIADRGPGVDKDEAEIIFSRGLRGRAAQGSQGSGLGLFIARRLMVEQCGGLSVEPRPGGGACFVATLPCAAETPAGPAPDREAGRHPGEELRAGVGVGGTSDRPVRGPS